MQQNRKRDLPGEFSVTWIMFLICTWFREKSLPYCKPQRIIQCWCWQNFWWSWGPKADLAFIRKHIYWQYYWQLCFWLRPWPVVLLLQLETTEPLALIPQSLPASDGYWPQQNETSQKKQWLAHVPEETVTSFWHDDISEASSHFQWTQECVSLLLCVNRYIYICTKS